jgi:hypothetical protein
MKYLFGNERPSARPIRQFGSRRRRREPYIPLVAFCLRHFLADFIICMCEFDFRQAQPNASTTNLRIVLTIPFYIGRLPTYNWSAVSILLVSLLLGKADCR